MRTVRWSAELEAKIAAWIERQPEPQPSLRGDPALIEKGLAAGCVGRLGGVR